jgi:hypothetical protein
MGTEKKKDILNFSGEVIWKILKETGLLEIGSKVCKINYKGDGLCRQKFMPNHSRKTSFFIHFSAEDKFSYCTLPSSHYLKVCYIQVWNNEQYHSDQKQLLTNFCSKQSLAITAVVWVKYRNYMLVLPIIKFFQNF